MKHWAYPQQGTLTYVALGDSAGVGVGVDDPTHCYVGLLAKRLVETTGHTVRVVNLSVSGARAIDVLEGQIPKLDTMPAPDVVTCVIGGNDVAWSRRFRADTFSRELEMIAARLPAGAVMASVPNFVHWPYEQRARRANRAIKRAASRYGHAFADLHSPTLREYLATFAGDWFHPNEQGHALWADAVWEHLSER